VPPAELEAVLLRHPDVTDAAVIGLPDDEAGEVRPDTSSCGAAPAPAPGARRIC